YRSGGSELLPIAAHVAVLLPAPDRIPRPCVFGCTGSRSTSLHRRILGSADAFIRSDETVFISFRRSSDPSRIRTALQYLLRRHYYLCLNSPACQLPARHCHRGRSTFGGCSDHPPCH